MGYSLEPEADIAQQTHGEAFLHLAGVGGSGRASVAGGVRGDAGHRSRRRLTPPDPLTMRAPLP